MNSLNLLLSCLCWLFAAGSLSAQIKFKLQVLPDSAGWGVYAKPEGVSPSASAITGAGQVTLVAPNGFAYTGLTNHGGTWSEDARVNAPAENPGMDYISFGFLTDYPQIAWMPDGEALLFTFARVGDCPDTLHLIDEADPFAQLPNSANSNPGNDIGVVDFGSSPAGIYGYEGNYAPSGWNCGGQASEPPQDTTAEDTTLADPQGPADEEAAGFLLDGHGGGSSENPSAASGQLQEAPWFHLAPNPTGDLIALIFEKQPPQGEGVVRLFGSSGVPLGKLEKGQGDTLHLQVGGLPPGLCLVTFEVDGKILQRERFVKL